MSIALKHKRLFQEYQAVIRPIAIFAGIVVGCLFGIIPASQTAWNVFGEANAVQAEITTLSKKISLLSSLDTATLKNDFSELAAALPSDKSIPTLFTTLEAASAQAGVSLLDVTLSPVGTLATESAKPAAMNVSGAYVVPFSASVQGTMLQMQEFLRLIGTVRRFLGIRSFDMTLTTVELVQAKIEMDTYYTPLPRELGGIAKELTPLSSQDESVIRKATSLPNLSRVAELPPPSIGAVVKADPFAP